MDAYPIIQSMIPWTEKIYDMTEEEIKKYKQAYSVEYHSASDERMREVIDVYYIEYQYHQLRKDYSWVQEQYRLSGDKMAIRREILLQRLRGSDNSPFAQEDIESLIANTKKSTDDLLINGQWLFKLYDHGQKESKFNDSKLDPEIPYFVGVDPAGGGNRNNDNTAIVILNPYNLQVAAEFKSPYVTQTNCTQILIELINTHIPKGIVIIEQNSVGRYLVQNLVDNTNIKKNLYWSENAANKILANISSYDPKEYELAAASSVYKKYGNYLTASVREAMMRLLIETVKDCKQIVNTQYLVEDICKLERNPKTKKIAAVQGAHDDVLMAYLHAMYIWQVGDNLENFGFIKPEIHPVLGRTQEDLDEYEETYDDWFSTKEVKIDSEEYAMQYAIMMENKCKEMAYKLPFIIDDPVYSHQSNSLDNVYDGTTSISPYFFAEVNGLEI